MGSSASSKAASASSKASSASSSAAASANASAASKAKQKVKEMAKQDVASQKAADNEEPYKIAIFREYTKTVRDQVHNHEHMIDFLTKHCNDLADWRSLFNQSSLKSLNSALRKAMIRFHPDKIPVDAPARQRGFMKGMSAAIIDFMTYLKDDELATGGTRRRSRHTKNKTGRKRRTHRR